MSRASDETSNHANDGSNQASTTSMTRLPHDLLSNLKFGPFTIASQAFHISPSRLSYALVNLKPLLPGHILVCPVRCTPRLFQLTSEETADLFLTVRNVSKTISRVYKANALNVAVQDGVEAGQSVPHVHVHVIPRRGGDMDEQGGGDAIYGLMDGEEGNLGKAFIEMQRQRKSRNGQRDYVAGPDADRKPRSEEEMAKEATLLAEEMKKDDQDSG